MRMTLIILALATLGLSGCGSEPQRTVVVNPAPVTAAPAPPGTVVVPPSGNTVKVCPKGYVNC